MILIIVVAHFHYVLFSMGAVFGIFSVAFIFVLPQILGFSTISYLG